MDIAHRVKRWPSRRLRLEAGGTAEHGRCFGILLSGAGFGGR